MPRGSPKLANLHQSKGGMPPRRTRVLDRRAEQQPGTNRGPSTCRPRCHSKNSPRKSTRRSWTRSGRPINLHKVDRRRARRPQADTIEETIKKVTRAGKLQAVEVLEGELPLINIMINIQSRTVAILKTGSRLSALTPENYLNDRIRAFS